MIFPKIEADLVVRENDSLRIDARHSTVRNYTDVKDILINPDDTDFISVYSDGDRDDWYLDWSYSVPGSYDVELKITDQSDAEFIENLTVSVIAESDDLTFSDDSDIRASEPDIKLYMPEGKTSYIYAHREARTRILAYLDENRIWKADNKRYEATDLFDKEEFRHWSRFLVLMMIFESKVTSVDDLFYMKRNDYRDLMFRARNRATLRLNPDQLEGEEKLLDRISTVMIKR